ncbi:hypothetical protein Tsp_01577 [Trichinella spiralis]|uniref:hypothetical protein n=1 Tax=Trichinella spiralis TaxID=6334 RepID=UPI0001EFC093|nr:hypothetical protein Tsp_01577 [Trichinella spiralis]
MYACLERLGKISLLDELLLQKSCWNCSNLLFFSSSGKNGKKKNRCVMKHSVARTQLLGHPRSAKAIKTHANAEKVTTAAALQAKVESQSDSSAFCVVHISSFTVGNFHKRRPKSDGVYVKNEAFRCSQKKPCGKAAWNLKHHRPLHQSGTMGNLKPAMGGYTS